MHAIREAQSQWRATIATLSLRILRETDPDCELVRESGLSGIRLWREEEWVWTDQGQFRVESLSYHGDQLRSHSLSGGDGKIEFVAQFSEADRRHPPLSVDLIPQVVKWTGATHYFLQGLWFPNERKWLADILNEGRVEYQGLETVSGRALHKVHVAWQPPTEPEPISDLVLWLDPEHQYLPRRVGARHRPTQRSNVTLEVDEFREAVPGWWFPVAARGELNTMRDHSRVSEIRLNARFDASLFKPPLQTGVLIRDHVRNVHYIVGGEAGQKIHRDRSRASYEEFEKWSATRAGASVPTRPLAQPGIPRLSRLGWWCVPIGATLMIAAALWRRRRRHGGPHSHDSP